ncbi:phytoene desaturase family protein [Naasia aerilata]|uniref:Pyridine nucleotide-disulfide oxidoreductase domain-containing protein 2 n=1 Tax=Naasia aerilata TaxID=1162966 RepID=A0ABN6XSJ9_9MICO|nr:NAD(P)/FAD-dependent oxidoreductase [Naasia aerilata]BDZ46418.1 phytoene dehydrogenase [Naasia aerilata]
MPAVDAVIVGAGPNGLAAAVTLARAGLSVQVFEAADTIGGGARTAETTLPGYRHDICSAVHPMAFASPFFTEFGLRDRVEFVTPEISFAHPLDGGRAGLAYRDLDRTVAELGEDGRRWASLFRGLVRRAADVAEFSGDTLIRVPRHPFTMARFGLATFEQGTRAWNARWHGDVAPALLSGAMAHAVQPLPTLGAAAAGLALVTQAHAQGWPIPIGGSQTIPDALADDLRAHGGTIEVGRTISSLDELPSSTAVLFDTSTRDLLRIAGRRLPDAYRRRLERFRYGSAVAKIDFALSGPVPWADSRVADAGTVHLGGTRADIAYAEREIAAGRHAARPYVLVSQPSRFDPTRAPEGHGTLWTYTHVPRYSAVDQTETVIRQIERFAPGFRDVILGSSSSTALQVEAHDRNYVGGDIAAGAGTFWQLVARPTFSPDPWRTPARGIYLCSSSAAPGPGVHGQAGWHAAQSALAAEFGIRQSPNLAPTEG